MAEDFKLDLSACSEEEKALDQGQNELVGVGVRAVDMGTSVEGSKAKTFRSVRL